MEKRRREKRRTGRTKRRRIPPTRPETKEQRLELCPPAAISFDIFDELTAKPRCPRPKDKDREEKKRRRVDQKEEKTPRGRGR